MNIRGFLPALVLALTAAFVAEPAAPVRAADDVSETRNVPGFDHVRLQGAFTAEISAGGDRTRVVVVGKSDVVGRVTTEVTDGTLVVGMRSGGGPWDGSPKLRISLPKLRSFSNEGAGSAHISGLDGGDISIENAGAGSITASGHAARETIALNGTGKIDTTAVDAGDVTVDNNGVGAVYVRARGQLTMSVNGVGVIRYTGKPTHVESQVNGIGHIGRL